MVESTRPAMTLRPYQEEALKAVLSPPAGVWRSLVVMATGAGKTVFFAAYLDRVLRPGRRGLVIAPREELLDQAAAKIHAVAPDISVEIEQAERRAGTGMSLFGGAGRRVVVGSVQSLHGRRRVRFQPDEFDVIIVDEAHHSSSKSYRDILEYFGAFDEVHRTPVVGVTATPERSDGVGLGVVYQSIACVYGISELVDTGYLVQPRAYRIESSVDLSAVKVARGDYDQSALEAAVNRRERNAMIVAAYQEYAAGRLGVVFAAGVDHAQSLAQTFSAAGIPAETVLGTTTRDVRAGIYRRFSSGATKVLCNYGVLTEGFDAPEISCVILARPTQSSLLITQMLGRGLRLHPGKADCVCLDVQDATIGRSCVSVPQLFGLPPRMNLRGRSAVKVRQRYDTLDPSVASGVESFNELAQALRDARLGVRATVVNLLKASVVPAEVVRYSRLRWYILDRERYGISLAGGGRAEIRVDTLGQWSGAIIQGMQRREFFAGVANIEEAFALADNEVCSLPGNTQAFLSQSQPWHSKPRKESQDRLLVRLGIFPSVQSIPSDLLRGGASLLISQALASRQSVRAV